MINTFKKDDAQALKGIAIIMMIFHHCFSSTELYEKYTISFFPFKENIIVNIAVICKICVALFAFISGYGLIISYEKKKATASRWALSRYIKTFSGFWIIYILLAFVNIIFRSRFLKVYFGHGIWIGIASVFLDFAGFAKLFGTDTLLVTWWYMSAAVVYILLVPLLYKELKDKTWIILIFSMFFLRVILSHTDAGSFTGSNSIYAFIPVFISGSIFATTLFFSGGY
ncbi:acyltransferase family protein [Butyrivibrio sp. YAB3001]|uniref:acyltransferase family protein n=1 Tax=Butyrivibrio sp. YAB3001 TaxID=1520812 RepID=UPI0008F62599|nr:acyltransferase family protein [Butyrivibrio sp. YAB3001]SFC80182.1 Acyltransferase family protein [Butyrivibrio sp. YAB3001]